MGKAATTRVLCALLLLISASSLPLLADKPPSKKDLEKLQSVISKTERQLDKQQSHSRKLEKQLRQTEVSLGKLKSRAKRLQTTIRDQQKQLNGLLARQKNLQLQSLAQQDEINNLITTSYRLGREKRIKVLLNQESPEKFSRSLIYADYLNKAHLGAIEAFRDTVAELETVKPVLQSKTKALLANKTELLNQQATLKNTLRSRESTLKQLNAEIDSDKGKLAGLRLERKELEELLKAVEKTVTSIQLPSDTVPFASTRGKLQRPVKGQLKNRYGKRRGSTQLRWEGVSFYANPGREVGSIHYGRVIFADWFRGKGLLMIIDHGDGYMSLYAHNQSLLREPGDWVSAGEAIATAGNTGGLDHTELYFEIRHQGKAVNPMKWLR
ncbi:Murein hydrolase activator EnvC [BD1-7 clade bacterium]|uniref:Murein hydrolase activator EnvC n=1 Tax=BD1-7 clade bacterium TaxID=2029982 RepID=A0A5S9MXG0_9GAMM|nr:Murein hydrolase activator EnvC [BD1-7 clade bacterium]